MVAAIILPISIIAGGYLAEDLALQWEESVDFQNSVERRDVGDIADEKFEIADDFSVYVQEKCECQF
jgi:hypothetical protein